MSGRSSTSFSLQQHPPSTFMSGSSTSFSRPGEKRSISVFSEASVVTQGGTKRQHKDARATIVTKAIKLMTQLEEHAILFEKPLGEGHEWFNSLNTTLLGSSRHLITSILVQGDNPINRKIASFKCEDPSSVASVANIIKNHTISLPTYADLAGDPVYGKHIIPGNDPAAHSLTQILLTQTEIADLADAVFGHQRRPPPFEFGQRGGWWKTQEGKDAILCHRPASKRPILPLKITHAAFYEFNRSDATFSDDELEEFRRAAFNLAKSVTDPLNAEKLRAEGILKALTGIFPAGLDYIWELEVNVANRGRVDLIYRRILPEHYNQRFASENKTPSPPFYTNVIIIEIKLEEGHGGDAFMQLCRYFDITIKSNPRYCETGAPTFLVTMSGPNIKFCGGWADTPGSAPAIDVFKTHFACLDVAGDHLEALTMSLCALKRAITFLPSCHIPEPGVSAIQPNIPAIFDTYQSFENDGPELGLRVLKPLNGDTRSSVFHVYAENIQPADAHARANGNCAAKLAFRHYGLEVHQALAPDFAPSLLGISSKPEIGASLYLMEYLAPPAYGEKGWVTLGDLTSHLIRDMCEDICSALSTFAQHLESLNLVHGDLRPNNIMIEVQAGFKIAVPVVIKVIDFEWANAVHKGRYPLHLNTNVGYPGTPGGIIETSHDTEMLGRCQDHVRAILGA